MLSETLGGKRDAFLSADMLAGEGPAEQSFPPLPASCFDSAATASTASSGTYSVSSLRKNVRLKLRLSGSARKPQKRFRDTFKFQAVLAIQPVLFRSVEKTGRPIPVQILRLIH